MVKKVLKNPEKSKTLQIIIIRLRSSTDKKLSVRNRCNPLIFERRYSVKETRNWLKIRKNSKWNCILLYPITAATTRLKTAYTTASRNFNPTMFDKCFFNRKLCCAMFLLLKLVIPTSRRIFSNSEKLNNAKYIP